MVLSLFVVVLHYVLSNGVKVSEKKRACHDMDLCTLSAFALRVYDFHEGAYNTTYARNEKNEEGIPCISTGILAEKWELVAGYQQDPKWGAGVGIWKGYYKWSKCYVIVVAVKGTTFDSLTGVDMGTNAKNIILGAVKPAWISNIKDKVDSVMAGATNPYKDASVVVTGHSLGGYTAEMLAVKYGWSGVGFQAPGTGVWTRYVMQNANEGVGADCFLAINAIEDGKGNYWYWDHKDEPVYVNNIRSHDITKMVALFNYLYTSPTICDARTTEASWNLPESQEETKKILDAEVNLFKVYTPGAGQ